MDLIEGIQKELTRNREILGMYEEIGTAGMFGATMIKNTIAAAERAIEQGDIVAMVKACKVLQETK